MCILFSYVVFKKFKENSPIEQKLFKNLIPTIRWVMLPFACVIAPLIASIFIGLIAIFSFWTDMEASYPIYNFIKECIQSLIISFAFSIAALYIAPSHTKIVMQIVRIVGASLIGLAIVVIYTHDSLTLNVFVQMIPTIIGILLKLEDDIIGSENED